MLVQAQKRDQKIREQIHLVSNDAGASIYTVVEGLLHYDQRVVVPDDADLKNRILHSRHDHVTAGHPGRTKTLKMVRAKYYWKGVKEYVDDYVDGCHKCQRVKTIRHKPYGLLKSLTVPDLPWTHLTMDFIDQLPLSNGFDTIFVVVDRLSKMAIFMCTTTKVTSLGLAHLFIQHVFSKHGSPTDIVSDRGNKFISSFWKDFCRCLGIQQSLSTAYRPQTDGQTERVNQAVEMFIRLYVNYDQDNWSEYVALAEFAYNNSPHSSTTMTPFFVNKGFNPTLEIKLAPGTKEAHGVEFSRIHEVHEHAKREILKAQEVSKKYADRDRIASHEGFQVGRKVWLSAQNIKTTRPTKKFADRRLGPYTITALIGTHAARLALPKSMSRIHPVFHFAYLEPAAIDTIAGRRRPPPVEVQLEDHEDEYEVSAILDSKRVSPKTVHYLVEWAGYQDDAYERETWEPASNITGAQEMLDEFHARHPDKAK